jgi:hydroxymethylpyrimidine pyrophosphatase-like HAD family hydrolase
MSGGISLGGVAVDLDGTLLGGVKGRHGFRPEGTRALRQVAAAGGFVAIVTGRDLDFILKLLEREGVALEDGWPHVIISEERYLHMWSLEQRRFVPDLEWNEWIFGQEGVSFDAIVQGMTELLAGPLTQLDPECYRVQGDIEKDRKFVELKFSSPEAAIQAEPYIADWLRRSAIPYEPLRNVSGIAIRHEQVGKGELLLKVCSRLGTAPGSVLAIGDSNNDLSMVDGRFGFIGGAPGNAESGIKIKVLAGGGYVAESGYGDGVAEIISQAMALQYRIEG